MKPYKHIQEAKKVLKTLSIEAKTRDNTLTRLKELNTLIETVNSFEKMLESKYYTEYFDILILNRLYQSIITENKRNFCFHDFVKSLPKDTDKGFLLSSHKEYLENTVTNEIDLYEFLMWLDQDISQGVSSIKDKLTSYMQGLQLESSLKKGKVFQDSKKTWNKTVDNLLSQIKERIVFNKRFK